MSLDKSSDSGTTLVDFNKPRTTKNLENQSISFGFRPSFNVNNVTGNPAFVLTQLMSFLRNRRVGSNPLFLELKSEDKNL